MKFTVGNIRSGHFWSTNFWVPDQIPPPPPPCKYFPAPSQLLCMKLHRVAHLPCCARSAQVAVPTPVAGAVLNVWVTVGQEVEAGEPLLTLTAMKMETTVTAPVSGVVAAVLDVVPGDVLGGGDDVATIRPADVTAPGAAVRAADPAEEEGWKGVVAELLERRRCARAQGGADRVAQHHAKGRLTLREKLDALLDAGTFEEVGPIAGLGERDEATGQLLGFTPANFLVGTGSMDGRMIVACGEVCCMVRVQGAVGPPFVWERGLGLGGGRAVLGSREGGGPPLPPPPPPTPQTCH